MLRVPMHRSPWKVKVEKTHERNITQLCEAIVLQCGKRKRMHIYVLYVGGTKPTKKNRKLETAVHTICFRPMVHEPAPPG